MSTRDMMLTASAVILLGVPAALADEFTLDWWTADGGGAMWTAGGDFELSGTIGQPDAGAVMTGGSYSLTGGFWALPAESAPLVGDTNCDGRIDFDDIDPFVVALTGAANYAAQYPDCRWLNADCDHDGDVDFDDIDPFVGLLGG